ncbi:hypothetical protein LX36DRAFT_361249 [Colletotrichum falcatum]|nr:hypothetical protein LX36DRAFT_361249 [Colletotrichum falcatum]
MHHRNVSDRAPKDRQGKESRRTCASSSVSVQPSNVLRGGGEGRPDHTQSCRPLGVSGIGMPGAASGMQGFCFFAPPFPKAASRNDRLGGDRPPGAPAPQSPSQFPSSSTKTTTTTVVGRERAVGFDTDARPRTCTCACGGLYANAPAVSESGIPMSPHPRSWAIRGRDGACVPRANRIACTGPSPLPFVSSAAAPRYGT